MIFEKMRNFLKPLKKGEDVGLLSEIDLKTTTHYLKDILLSLCRHKYNIHVYQCMCTYTCICLGI